MMNTFRLYATRITLLSILAGFSSICHAQLHWRPSAKHNDSLPASIRVYETTDSLDGHPFRAYYLKASALDKSISFDSRTGNGKRYTPAEYAAMETGKVYAVVNTTFFSFADNSSLNMVVSKGKTIAHNLVIDTIKTFDGRPEIIYPTQGVFGILPDGRPDIAWVYPAGKNKEAYAYDAPNAPQNGVWTKPTTKSGKRWKVVEAAGGAPVLLPYVSSVPENRFAWHELDKHPRTAIGYTADNEVIILAVEGRHAGVADGATLLQLARIMRELGCVEALNLDGGGSTTLWAGGQATIQPSDKKGPRPVPAVLLIKARDNN
ncbi:phosphodiester glycosidase family protein [Chitinophaga agrisoli]|uniref:Phosphodiester glycosidase family protein n=1 Tax=Chitinophaga agrisoli TaxID=2607653 RepID=A0A5B2VKE5_9BACT|nr:phosphodiester glycosidase family protein [Chitinophaga agrisoli]KAA2239274.1 phosphodiester glycosidase family protein [Chitinophaga agrisoli]